MCFALSCNVQCKVTKNKSTCVIHTSNIKFGLSNFVLHFAAVYSFVFRGDIADFEGSFLAIHGSEIFRIIDINWLKTKIL